jgi:hypothetical protein
LNRKTSKREFLKNQQTFIFMKTIELRKKITKILSWSDDVTFLYSKFYFYLYTPWYETTRRVKGVEKKSKQTQKKESIRNTSLTIQDNISHDWCCGWLNKHHNFSSVYSINFSNTLTHSLTHSDENGPE